MTKNRTRSLHSIFCDLRILSLIAVGTVWKDYEHLVTMFLMHNIKNEEECLNYSTFKSTTKTPLQQIFKLATHNIIMESGMKGESAVKNPIRLAATNSIVPVIIGTPL